MSKSLEGPPPRWRHGESDEISRSGSVKRDSGAYDDGRRYRDTHRDRDRKRKRCSDSPDNSQRRHSPDRVSGRRGYRSRDRDRPRERDRGRRSPADREERPQRGYDSDHGRSRRKYPPRRRSPNERHHRLDRDEYDEPLKAAQGKDLVEKSRSPLRSRGPLPSQEASFAVEQGQEGEPVQPVEKPNFNTTGRLAAASNSVTKPDGTVVVLKYHEPSEARKPPSRMHYKMFVFDGADIVDEIPLHARSCWLIGRDRAIVDYPTEDSSVSKQHAVIQFRYMEKKNEFGDSIGKVKPYLLDLESANGTMLNGEEIADSRYYELRDKDMVQFGDSTREYILMVSKD